MGAAHVVYYIRIEIIAVNVLYLPQMVPLFKNNTDDKLV